MEKVENGGRSRLGSLRQSLLPPPPNRSVGSASGRKEYVFIKPLQSWVKFDQIVMSQDCFWARVLSWKFRLKVGIKSGKIWPENILFRKTIICYEIKRLTIEHKWHQTPYIFRIVYLPVVILWAIQRCKLKECHQNSESPKNVTKIPDGIEMCIGPMLFVCQSVCSRTFVNGSGTAGPIRMEQTPKDAPKRRNDDGVRHVPCAAAWTLSKTAWAGHFFRTERRRDTKLSAYVHPGTIQDPGKWRPRGFKIVPAGHNFVFQPYAL